MLYAALAFFIAGLTALSLGFLGLIRGAAGFVNVTFMFGLILLALGGMANYWRRHLHH